MINLKRQFVLFENLDKSDRFTIKKNKRKTLRISERYALSFHKKTIFRYLNERLNAF
jgi:hypothetical protein